MVKNKLAIIFLTAILVINLPAIVLAQSYSIIDGDIGIYCADLPDGTNSIVRVNSNNGLYTVNPVDPEAEKAAIIKLRKDLQKRISTLSKIKKDYEPTADIKTLKQNLKFISDQIVTELESDGSLDKVSPAKIYKKIGTMITLLKHRLEELQTAIETIDRCVRNEDLIPAPSAPDVKFIYFNFRNPDYGTIEVMRGYGFTAELNKKAYSGSLCVGAAKPRDRIPVFPKEAEYVVTRNPCLGFYQTAFRNYPFCQYDPNPNVGVAWFSTTSAGFSSSAVTEKEIESANKSLAFYSPFSIRIPTKKRPCNTGK